MKYIVLPEQTALSRITFDFAVEEYAARYLTDDDYCFIWQTQPTVIIGRNQLLDNEVNTDYCQANHIFVARRKSGGGCVYSDPGNLMFSFISNEPDTQKMFKDCMTRIADALCRLNIPATLSGRNDILVDGKKVAGAAFFRTGQRGVMHNTLLFRSDMTALQRAITPTKEKLQSKGVKSVSQRVANISDYTTLTLDEFKQKMRRELCGDEAVVIDEDQLREIKKLEAPFADEKFIYGRRPTHTLVHKKRIPDVGSIEVYLELKDGHIHDLDIIGDYFLTGDLDRELISLLRRKDYTREAVTKALEGTDVGTVIRNLTLDHLLDVLFDD